MSAEQPPVLAFLDKVIFAVMANAQAFFDQVVEATSAGADDDEAGNGDGNDGASVAASASLIVGECLKTGAINCASEWKYSKPRISRIQVDRQIYPSYAKIRLMRSEI